MFLCVYKKHLCEFAICGKITENQERIKMSIFNKCMMMIAFAVCTTNAWAGICAKQKVEKLNNDKYLYVGGGYAFVCGGGGENDCSNGTKVYSDLSYIVHRNKEFEPAHIVECSDKPIDSKWVNKTDVGIGSLKKCSYDQWKEWSENYVFINTVIVYCKKMSDFFTCVSMNNEDVCYLYDHTMEEFYQQKAAEEEAENSENKASETKTDCGNVGQRECDGKFYVCKNNADCGSDHLPSHATAGHCVSAGRSGYKVCTATNCGENYELARDKNGNSMGWCRKKSSNSGIQFGCAKLKFNDGTECSNINFGRSWKANSKFEGVVRSEDENVYGSCLDNKLTDKCNRPLWDLDTVDGQSVKDLVEGATAIDFHKDREVYEIEIFDCDREKGYVPGEVLHEWNNNPDEYSYKKCVKKSNNGESESGVATSTTVFDNLDKFISEKFVGSSVWKNDEGNFNTARLVSDSVAGVVLGTAGGVITSHIIKKNQIENGFDDLKCTIGGQTVASYGDEFRVGVK